MGRLRMWSFGWYPLFGAFLKTKNWPGKSWKRSEKNEAMVFCVVRKTKHFTKDIDLSLSISVIKMPSWTMFTSWVHVQTPLVYIDSNPTTIFAHTCIFTVAVGGSSLTHSNKLNSYVLQSTKSPPVFLFALQQVQKNLLIKRKSALWPHEHFTNRRLQEPKPHPQTVFILQGFTAHWWWMNKVSEH